jgi:hypothetical protein
MLRRIFPVRLGLQLMAGLAPPSPSRFAGGVMSAIRPRHTLANVVVNKLERLRRIAASEE